MKTTTMNKVRLTALAAMLAVAGVAMAETMKGRVDSVDAGGGTLQLNGITFQTTPKTSYHGFASLQAIQQGDSVAVDFSRDGSRYVASAVTRSQ